MLANPGEMTLFMVIIVLAGFMVCSFGLQKGLERISKWMMTGPAALIVILAVNSLTLDGAMEGVKFYLLPDFERAAEVARQRDRGRHEPVLLYPEPGHRRHGNLRQLYVRRQPLTGEAVRICCLDTFVALMSGMIIFPACFSFGRGTRPGTLPDFYDPATGVRQHDRRPAVGRPVLPVPDLRQLHHGAGGVREHYGQLHGQLRLVPEKATIVCGIFILLASMPCVLGYNLWYFEASLPSGATGQILDIEDFLVSNLLLPIGSLIYLLFCVSKWG